MFVVANFVQGIAVVLGYLIDIFWLLIVVRALLSWVNPDPQNPIVQFVERVTEPFLTPFRRLIPAHSIGIDLSPLAALLFLVFLKYFLIQTLFGVAARLR